MTHGASFLRLKKSHHYVMSQMIHDVNNVYVTSSSWNKWRHHYILRCMMFCHDTQLSSASFTKRFRSFHVGQVCGKENIVDALALLTSTHRLSLYILSPICPRIESTKCLLFSCHLQDLKCYYMWLHIITHFKGAFEFWLIYFLLGVNTDFPFSLSCLHLKILKARLQCIHSWFLASCVL